MTTPDDDHEGRANDLANALTLAAPGYLRKTLESCTPEELEVVARIVRRYGLVRDVERRGGLLRG